METTAKSDRRSPLLARISSKLGGWHERNGLVLLDSISASVPQSESKDLNPFDDGSGLGSSTNVSKSRSGLIVIIIPKRNERQCLMLMAKGGCIPDDGKGNGSVHRLVVKRVALSTISSD